MLGKFIKNVITGFFQLLLKFIGWNPILPLIPELYLLNQSSTIFIHNFNNILINLIVFLYYGANPDHPIFNNSSYFKTTSQPKIKFVSSLDKNIESPNGFIGGLDFTKKEFIIQKINNSLTIDQQLSPIPSLFEYINLSTLIFFSLFFIGLYFSYFYFNLNILNIIGVLSLFFKFI